MRGHEKAARELLEDGHGNAWERCDSDDCSLQIVRPGKVQCDDYQVMGEYGFMEWVQPCVWKDAGK